LGARRRDLCARYRAAGADPFAARGGFPATQGSLEVRNDFVQHAGSAMLAWADVLKRRQ